MLSPSVYSPVQTVSEVAAAKICLSERSFDFIIINSPLPDESGIRFAIDAVSLRSTVVLLLVRADIYAETHERVSEHGIFTLPKPISKQTLLLALNWMEAARERLRSFEEKTLSIEEKMKEIRIVNKAKWLLISELEMDEAEAHRYIEKQAMDHCRTKKEIAEEIIKTYS